MVKVFKKNIMFLGSIVMLFVVSLCCNTSSRKNGAYHNIEDTNFFGNKALNIYIQSGENYVIDLKREIYTVFYNDLSSKKQTFQLSTLEKKTIQNELEKLRKIDIVDSIITNTCNQHPEIFTRVVFKKNNEYKTVYIDLNCNVYRSLEKETGFALTTLINTIEKIVFSKKEIKNIPKSNIGYM